MSDYSGLQIQDYLGTAASSTMLYVTFGDNAEGATHIRFDRWPLGM